MGQQDLKKKFERVHLKSESSDDLKTSITEKQKMRFKSSNMSELHQQIKNATPVSTVDWKNQLTNHYVRPTLSAEVKPLQQQLQWTLNRLLGRSVLLSFFVKKDEASVLEKISKHMQERNDFWFSLLKEANQIHIRTGKGKLQIWLKSDESIQNYFPLIQTRLEREYVSHPQQLRSFQVKNADGWIEVQLDVDLHSLETRYKGSDL